LARRGGRNHSQASQREWLNMGVAKPPSSFWGGSKTLRKFVFIFNFYIYIYNFIFFLFLFIFYLKLGPCHVLIGYGMPEQLKIERNNLFDNGSNLFFDK
jgi:hypothetical protein